jgi:GTPase SAR1 family protein
MSSLQILLYGTSGSGKTTIASRAKNPFFIDLENGCLNVPKDRKMSLPIIGYNEASKASVKKLNNFLDDQLSSNNEKKFDTLVIDSITRLDEFMEQEVIDEEKIDSKGKALRSLSDLPYGSGYSMHSHKIMNVVYKCMALSVQKDMDLILISHAKEKQVKVKNKDPYDAVMPRLAKGALNTTVELVQCCFYTSNGKIPDPNKEGSMMPMHKIVTTSDSYCEFVKNRINMKHDAYYVYRNKVDFSMIDEFWAELYEQLGRINA